MNIKSYESDEVVRYYLSLRYINIKKDNWKVKEGLMED